MEDHFIYSRPVVVTEDKIKEALAKQANQRALKAALDQQVLETERLKAEAYRAKGKREKQSAPSKSGVSPTALPEVADERLAGQKASPSTSATPGPSPPAPPAPPSTAPVSAHAGPSSAIEPTRYTFSFKEGQGKFEMTDRSVRPLKDTLQPSSAEGNAREKRRNAPQPAKRAPSSRDSARDTAGSRSSSRARLKASPGGAAASPAGTGEYQTNSLPANFKLGKDTVSRAAGGVGSRERGGSGSRPSRGASREKGGSGAAAGRGGGGGDGSSGYDTQSLPVELIYKLSQGGVVPGAPAGAAANTNVRSPLSRLKPPHPPKLTSPPKRSPSTSRISDSVGLRSPMSAQSGSPGSAVRERSVPLSPRPENAAGGRPPVSPRGGAAAGRLNTPLDGAAGVRRSARPAGGLLPPLNGRRDSDVIEMSAVLDARTPMRDNASTNNNNISNTGGGAPRRRTSSTPHERSPAPPGAAPSGSDVAAAAELARKQAEREKGWAQQVKQLKAELRKARQKAGGKGGNGKVDEALAKAPRRAETAPDPPAYPPGKAPRGIGGGGARQRRGEGNSNINNNNSNMDHAGPARPTRLEKMDFSKAHIFSRETFRPITAPEDAASYFGNLLASPGPAPRTPLPLVQPKASPPPAPPVAAAAVGAERGLSLKRAGPAPVFSAAAAASTHAEQQPQHQQQQQASTQNSTHTTTSGEESLKLASLTTRQITLGLPDYGDGDPVPIQFLHLRQFVEAQIITANQAETLWEFFSLSVPVEFGGSGGGPHAPHNADEEQQHVPPADSAERDEEQYDLDEGGEEAAMEESHSIEVEEMQSDRSAARPKLYEARHKGSGDAADADEESGEESGEEDVEDDDENFFIPHSPSQPPANAVLAPALRRKISQLHSEEAALLLQHHQQFRNGRQRPGAGAAAKGKGETAKDTNGAPASSPHGSDDSEPEGTFDTYSELKLSRNRVPVAGGEEEDL